MMTRKPQCVDCKLAHWEKTKTGRLHPSGDGKCQWTMPAVRLPVSMWLSHSNKPSGGHINRRDDWKQCPQYQKATRS